MIITALDTETTGLNSDKHEIIQLGFLKLELTYTGDLVTLDSREFNITPENISSADSKALLINGYTPEKWKNSVSFSSIVPELNKLWTDTDFLLGQNLIFDLRFINKTYTNLKLPAPSFPKYLDTKQMAMRMVNEGVLRSSSMDSLCEHFKIKYKGRAHTALTDCERTVKLWQLLVKFDSPEEFSFKEPYDPYANTNAGKVDRKKR